MLSMWLGSAAAIILLVGVVYAAQQKFKKQEQEELLDEKLEEAENTQHEGCGGHCGGGCNCQHEEGEEHECCGGHCGEGCHCEDLHEEEPVMLAMEEPEEDIVFINEGASSSKKYHNRPDAHNMDGAVAVSRKRAEEEGFVPCGKCFKN